MQLHMLKWMRDLGLRVRIWYDGRLSFRLLALLMIERWQSAGVEGCK